MVQPIINEEKRRASMVRCPEFEECDCPLCPLDPYLKFKVMVPGKELCPWVKRINGEFTLAQIPPVVLDNLPIYLALVSLSRFLTAEASEVEP